MDFYQAIIAPLILLIRLLRMVPHVNDFARALSDELAKVCVDPLKRWIRTSAPRGARAVKRTWDRIPQHLSIRIPRRVVVAFGIATCFVLVSLFMPAKPPPSATDQTPASSPASDMTPTAIDTQGLTATTTPTATSTSFVTATPTASATSTATATPTSMATPFPTFAPVMMGFSGKVPVQAEWFAGATISVQRLGDGWSEMLIQSNHPNVKQRVFFLTSATCAGKPSRRLSSFQIYVSNTRVQMTPEEILDSAILVSPDDQNAGTLCVPLSELEDLDVIHEALARDPVQSANVTTR